MRGRGFLLGAALIAATTCLGATAPEMRPEATRAASLTDIVLVADNTGITAAEWGLQKKAYLAMLDDASLIPRDGSVAISLVQYVNPTGRSQSSRVTVPLVPVTATSLAAIRKKLTAAALLSAQHQGDEAFASAISQLTSSGRDGAMRSICGTATTPWSSAQVATAAQSIKSAAIDRASMVHTALGSKPTSETADLSTLTAGDGSTVGTRSLAQAMSFLVDACLYAPVRLRAIEVNQVIQNWNNDIPLVEDKATVVRVFLETITRTSDTASGVLHGSRDGVALPDSPLSPVNDGEEVEIGPDADARSVRSDIGGSLNYVLPTSWLTGDVELRFEATSDLVCAGSPAGRDCAVDVSFIEGDDPDITYVRVPYRSSGDLHEPTSSESSEWMKRMRDAFPVADINDRYLVTAPAIPWAPTMADVMTILYYNREFEVGGEVASGERWIGVVAGDPDPDWGGFALDVPGYVAAAEVDSTGGAQDYGWARNSAVHETAHLYGAHHIVNEDQNGTVEGEEGTYPAGWCGEKGRVEAPDYPYWYSFSGGDAPTLGPMTDPDEAVWGVTPRFFSVDSNLALSDPYSVFPLMSYCSGPDESSQILWPDVQTYDLLTKKFLDTSFSVTSRTLAAASKTTLPGLWVRGTIDPAGAASATFAPTLPFPRAQQATQRSAVDATDTGFHINLLDLFGKPVATYDVPALEGSGRQQPHADDTLPTPFPFSAVFPATLDKRVASITVTKDSPGQQPEVLQTLTRSAKVPRITLQVGRPTLSGVTVSWVALDQDSSTLTTSVLYRTNAQAAWRLVALDATSDSVVIPRSMLPGSPAGQFAAMVSDGVNTTTVLSRRLTMPNMAPTVAIDGVPRVVLIGGQNTVLTALAHDVEDGDISADVTWRVGKTTVTGTGSTLTLTGDDLPEGSHVVVATVRDSDGRSAATTFRITVKRLGD